MATRLWQNTAKVHFDATARPLKLTASRPGMRVRAVVERWQEAAPPLVPTP